MSTADSSSTVHSLGSGTTTKANVVDDAAFRDLLAKYQDALNNSNTEAAMSLYSEDAVLMAPHSQSVVGKPAIRKLYEVGSKTFQMQVRFKIDEINEMSPEWAFVRTNSAGTLTIYYTGAQSSEANQELFILNKGTDGAWKIARYSFSSTKPPV